MLVAGIQAAGYEPGEDVAIALDPATSELYRDGAYVLEHEGRTLERRRAGRLLGEPGRALPDRLDRGRHGRGGLGRLEGAHRAPRRKRAARRRRPVRHQHRAPAPRHRAGRGQLDPDQGQPDRHADRDARGDRDGARGGLHGRHEPPLGRDRGRDDRRPRGGHRLRADQDRRPVALGPGGQVQPAAAHRGAARRRRRVPRALARSAAERPRAGAFGRASANATGACRQPIRWSAPRGSSRRPRVPGAPRVRATPSGRAACAGTGWGASRCCACWLALALSVPERRHPLLLDLARGAARQRPGARARSANTSSARAASTQRWPARGRSKRRRAAGHDQPGRAGRTSSAACPTN